QMIGSMFQAARVRTIDQNSNLFVRFGRFTNENDFLKEYGDADDDELLQQSGTIPQALLRMNGRFTRELTKTELFSSAGQIMRHSDDDLTVIQNCFLACLTRLPDAEERDFFLAQLSGTRREREGGGKSRIEQSPTEVALDTVKADSSETDTSGDDSVDAHDSSPNDGAPTSAVESVSRQEAVRDLFWILFNSPGFSWNR
ncbi:MAG: hypothetical protein KDA81_18365, partial [Planctomycetaceae bacterium]|nr:hypothetical protein [Planctomycetaceae bacterium]